MTRKKAPTGRRSSKLSAQPGYPWLDFGVEVGVTGPMPLQLERATTQTAAYALVCRRLQELRAAGVADHTEVIVRIGVVTTVGRTPMITRVIRDNGGTLRAMTTKAKTWRTN